jgi:16S rRNA (guanine(966)-N(2))-methyltransferase RsmD
MRAQLRIVSGKLRGRKLQCDVHPGLRPTPDMVREALFSILGNAVPNREFYDVFAGTGVIGLEAISRGAASATFVERDFRLVESLERSARAFDVAKQTTVVRADFYRWAERWTPPLEPVTLFLSPPFEDLDKRPEEFLGAVELLRGKIAADSVLVLQLEESAALQQLPEREQYDERRYGRNVLLFWVKEAPAA